MNREEERKVCRHCFRKGGDHRGNDGRCPGNGNFPKWPHTIKDQARADEVFDRRIAKFWTERTTSFQERT